MGHAGDLADGTGPVEVYEPGIAIGMQPSSEAGEMVLRVLTLAVAGEPIPGGGWGVTAPLAMVLGPCMDGSRVARGAVIFGDWSGAAMYSASRPR